MLLVAKSKYGREHQLGYDKKTREYVYLHNCQETWREKGDTSLLDYFNHIRVNHKTINENEIEKLPTFHIWVKYCKM